MSETTTIVMSIVGATISIIGVSGLMLRLPATSIAREFNSTNKRIDDLKADLNSRIDGTNGRIDDLKADLNGRIARPTSGSTRPTNGSTRPTSGSTRPTAGRTP